MVRPIVSLAAKAVSDGEMLPSIVPAITSSGARPSSRVNARRVAMTSASERLRLPGEISAQPIIKPPAPCAVTIESSSTPWAITNSNRPPLTPYACVRPNNPPRLMPLFTST